MTPYLLDPLEPLIFGDGRPANAGGKLRSLILPHPSTLAGMVRTRAGSKDGHFCEKVETVLQWQVHGPLLAQRSPKQELLVAAPADALWLETGIEKDKKQQLVPLLPIPIPDNSFCSCPELMPVGQPNPAKPAHKPPAFWRWSEFEKWLCADLAKHKPEQLDPATIGIPAPAADARMHVGVDPESQTAIDGALFGTVARSFVRMEEKKLERYGLAFWSDAPLTAGVAQAGGERRFVQWEKSTFVRPAAPQAVLDSAINGALRVILLTPARFTKGAIPTWLLEQGAELKAMVNGRALPVSGWDLVTRGPKKVSRLLPAGSVLYLSLRGTPLDKKQFVNKFWFQTISDQPQDQRDGFGLAVFGVWNRSSSPSQENP